jgi:uncharacterized protein (DUF1330 family)
MTAYLISDITVRDRAAFEVYRTRAADAIRTYGGRYLACLEQARAWYRSTEYAFALEVHDKALSRNLILVDGVSQPAVVK